MYLPHDDPSDVALLGPFLAFRASRGRLVSYFSVTSEWAVIGQ